MERAFHGIPRELVPLRYRALLSSVSRLPPRAAGEAREALRAALESHLGLRVALTSSARAGLFWLLEGLGRRHPGGEVVLFNYNFFAVPRVVAAAGLRPVFVDSAETHGEPGVDAVERALTPRTVALLVSHHFGRPSTMGVWQPLAERRGLALFEDCAHAFGARHGGASVGSFGEGGVFSLSLTKALTGVAGGVVVTRDDAVARGLARREAALAEPSPVATLQALLAAAAGKALLDRHLFGALVLPAHRRLLAAGRGDFLGALMSERPARDARPPAASKLPGPFAALATTHLRDATAETARRRDAARRLLTGRRFSRLELPAFEDDRFANHLMLPVRARDPDALRLALAREGFDTRRDYLSATVADPRAFPHSTRLAREGVYLPIRGLDDAAEEDRLLAALARLDGRADAPGLP